MVVGAIGVPMLLVGIGVVLALAFTSCKPKPIETLIVEKVRVDSIFAVRVETLTVRLREKARVDSLVRVVNDTTLLVRDSLVVVPPLVVSRITVCDSTLVASLRVGSVDSARVKIRDQIISAKASRVERWAGIGYDPIEKYGSVTMGASVNLYKGFGLDAYIDQPLIYGEKPYVRVLIGYWRTF